MNRNIIQKITRQEYLLMPFALLVYFYLDALLLIKDEGWVSVTLSFLILNTIIYGIAYIISKLCTVTTVRKIVLSFAAICLVFGNTQQIVLLVQKYSSTFGRNRYVLSSALVLVSLFIAFLFRTKRRCRLLSIYTILVLISLSTYLAIVDLRGPEKPQDQVFDFRQKISSGYTQSKIPLKYLPDIYYIVLDSYTSSISLKQYFSFDNSPFEKALSDRGFAVAPYSQSLFYSTYMSMNSTLNISDNSNFESMSLDESVYHLKNSIVIRALAEKGYNIYNYSIFPLAGTKKYYTIFNEDINFQKNRVESIIFIYKRIIRNSAFYGVIRFLDLSSVFDRTLKIFKAIPEIRKNQNLPVFMYAHIFPPHLPPIIDRFGRYKSILSHSPSSNQTGYIDQVIGINTYIIKLIDEILANYQTDNMPIIIIQGDHGSRIVSDVEEAERERTTIMNAYFMPKGGNVNIYPTISPYNTFRIIFNTYFDAEYELLPDIYPTE